MGGDLVYRCAATGEELQLDAYPVHAGLAAGIRASEWDISAGALGSLSGGGLRKPREAKLTVACLTRDAADAVAEAMDSDSRAGVPGTLVAFGGWEQRAMPNGVTLASADAGSVVLEVSLVLPDGCWRRTTVLHLLPSGGTDTVETGLDLPSDLPLDPSCSATSLRVTVGTWASRLLVGAVFLGPCASPYVTVTSESAQGHVTNRYGVSASADAGELIVIDPLGRGITGKAVYRVGVTGATANLYDARLRGTEGSGTYVWQALPGGDISASWPQSIGVDLSLIEERGVLPWS